jgi:AcrR family transcriptional regulator
VTKYNTGAMTDQQKLNDANDTWYREALEEAFRPYLEIQQDRSPQGRKRLRILGAATALFEKHGYRKTSVDEIARKAEVAKGTVYLYYPNKQRILIDAIAMQKLALMSKLMPLFTGDVPPADRLRRYIQIVLASAKEVPLAMRLMQGDGELAAVLDEVGEDVGLAENVRRGKVWTTEMIEQAAPGVFTEEEKHLRADALLSLGFISVMLMEERVRFGRSFEELAAALADMFVFGVVHRPPEKE